VINRTGVDTRRVFVDASAYFAFFNDRDVDHARIAAVVRQLATSRVRLFTTNLILAKTHACVAPDGTCSCGKRSPLT
jgi:predicted nucleic acid-binding protein